MITTVIVACTPNRRAAGKIVKAIIGTILSETAGINKTAGRSIRRTGPCHADAEVAQMEARDRDASWKMLEIRGK